MCFIKKKHIGTGTGTGLKKINPVTDMELKEDAVMEMDTIQIGGVGRHKARPRKQFGSQSQADYT